MEGGCDDPRRQNDDSRTGERVLGSPLGREKNPAVVSCATESREVARVCTNGFVGDTSKPNSRCNEIIHLSRVRDGNPTP